MINSKARELKLIAEIHEEFDSAQERLLKQAQEILDKPLETKTSQEELAERLEHVGFVNSIIVKEFEKKTKQRASQMQEKIKTQQEAEIIQHYQQNYPFLKFLTESELERICEKYNLIHAPVANYIGSVPEKNLKDIETVQPLKEKDAVNELQLLNILEWWPGVPEDLKIILKKKVNFEERVYSTVVESAVLAHARKHGYNGDYTGYSFRNATIKVVDRSGLFICAPKNNFNLEGLKEEKGWFKMFEIEVNDPIVYRYCRGGIQVLTKWGLEGSDPKFVLPVNN